MRNALSFGSLVFFRIFLAATLLTGLAIFIAVTVVRFICSALRERQTIQPEMELQSLDARASTGIGLDHRVDSTAPAAAAPAPPQSTYAQVRQRAFRRRIDPLLWGSPSKTGGVTAK
jgi:hypothetical protein